MFQLPHFLIAIFSFWAILDVTETANKELITVGAETLILLIVVLL